MLRDAPGASNTRPLHVARCHYGAPLQVFRVWENKRPVSRSSSVHSVNASAASDPGR